MKNPYNPATEPSYFRWFEEKPKPVKLKSGMKNSDETITCQFTEAELTKIYYSLKQSVEGGATPTWEYRELILKVGEMIIEN